MNDADPITSPAQTRELLTPAEQNTEKTPRTSENRAGYARHPFGTKGAENP